MSDQESETPVVDPRRKISGDAVFFAMATRLPITPTMTFCEEVAARANRYATCEIRITEQGTLMTTGPEDSPMMQYMTRRKVGVHKLVDMQGLIEGEWPEEMVKACVAGCSVYGILGMT